MESIVSYSLSKQTAAQGKEANKAAFIHHVLRSAFEANDDDNDLVKEKQ